MTRRELGWMAGLALCAGALVAALLAAGPEGEDRVVAVPGERVAGARGDGAASAAPGRELRAAVDAGELERAVPERPPATPAEERREPSPAAREQVTDWLRRVLPERFGELSDAELLALENLDLRGAELREEELALLAMLPRLRGVSLRGCPLTDAGMWHLRLLSNLESLDLRGTAVTGAGMGYLPTARMEALHLTDTHVRGEDLRFLPPMPLLRTLKLNFLELGDADLEALSIYPGLRHLELDQTGLTAEGLRRLLEQHSTLERVELRGTQVPSAALPGLAALLPGCELVGDSGRPVRAGT